MGCSPFSRGGGFLEKTKYNVDKDVAKRTYDDIVFDSVLEMKYYRDVVLPLMESGEITKCELQKKYVLQEGFTHDGMKVRPITYDADFYLEYRDGHSEVIDVKGCPDTTAKLKRKLFWHQFPNDNYIWVTYIKKYGGWGRYDEFNRMRKLEKRAKGGKRNGDKVEEER